MFSHKIQFNEQHTLSLTTGFLALKSGAAVQVNCGDSVILVTANVNEKNINGAFANLNVNYVERLYSIGRIPGGYLKREGRQSENEILVSRLIDRAFRPLIDVNFWAEIQIIINVMSYDTKIGNSDILAMYGTAAALKMLQIPMRYEAGFARLVYLTTPKAKNDSFVINPEHSIATQASLDLVIASQGSNAIMLEVEAGDIPEEVISTAVELGIVKGQQVARDINDFVAGAAVKPITYQLKSRIDTAVRQQLEAEELKIYEVYAYGNEIDINNYLEDIVSTYNLDPLALDEVAHLTKSIAKKIFKEKLLASSRRLDGRNNKEIRPIEIHMGLLPSAHGSALFTRGNTQSLGITTLDADNSGQIIDSLDDSNGAKENFMLHYYFPAYAVGEVGKVGLTKRREIGHGRLARKALIHAVPAAYNMTIRNVSEILSSDGSSSMASVCSNAMSMLNAGVPLKFLVAGVAMGLVQSQDSFSILTDINQKEDMLGDIDLKVAGSSEGITAVQMDIDATSPGLDLELFSRVVQRAQEAIKSILVIMDKAKASSQPSKKAPISCTISVNQKDIKFVVGKGGANIKNIIKKTGATININSDNGSIEIMSADTKSMQETIKMIETYSRSTAKQEV